MIRARHLLLPAVLVAGLTLTGCSGGSSESADSSAGADSSAAEAPAAMAEGGDSDSTLARDGVGSQAYDAAGSRAADQNTTAERAAPAGLQEPAVISTGTITVESDDVARARFELDKVVDRVDGSIADEKTTGTSEGEVRLSRLVLRVPSDDFDAAMEGLAGLGEVTDETRKAQDVTGEVIDTEARIRAQEQSLARVEVLFARAQSIRDVVAVEAQLSRRQAELDSLQGRLAWLEDQTTYSTITVYLEPAPEPAAATPEREERNPFVTGLDGGWGALTGLGAGLATLAGALLPFAVVALLLGVPLLLLVRRWLVSHPVRRPTAEA